MMFEHSLPDSLEAASPVYPSDSDLQNDARTKHFLLVPSKMWQNNRVIMDLLQKRVKPVKPDVKPLQKRVKPIKPQHFIKKI